MCFASKAFELRPAHSGDLLFAWSLYEELMKALTIELLGRWNEAGQKQVIEWAVAQPDTSIIVKDGLDVGWMQVIGSPDSLYLGQLYVVPSQQNRGIGTAILRDLIGKARSNGKAFTLEVLKNNRARLLYERLGFRVIGQSEYKLRLQWQALTPDETRVAAWAEVREALELQLAPLGRRALEVLTPRPGESVLDIGCGGGETALELARAVAPGGAVLGVDLSAAVLAFAQHLAKDCERVRFVQADAQVFPFEPASFDAAFSRFGVMFFADPTAAFINIRRSLRPNGRVAFVCWRALEENPLDVLPLQAASAHLPQQPTHDPDAPGPFAFANPDRVRSILEGAGFEEIEIAAHDEEVGSGDLETMLAVCSRVGALGKILRENRELRTAALPAVRSALAAHDGPDGVRLNAATWVVTARAPTRP